jgi:hypothetical protein
MNIIKSLILGLTVLCSAAPAHAQSATGTVATLASQDNGCSLYVYITGAGSNYCGSGTTGYGYLYENDPHYKSMLSILTLAAMTRQSVSITMTANGVYCHIGSVTTTF